MTPNTFGYRKGGKTMDEFGRSLRSFGLNPDKVRDALRCGDIREVLDSLKKEEETLLLRRVEIADCFGPVFSTGIGFTWESVRGNLYTQAEEKGESPGRPLRQDRIEPGDYREKPFELYQKTPKIFPCPSPVFSAKVHFVSTVSANGAAFFSERSVRTS